jgi:hypothetical protein
MERDELFAAVTRCLGSTPAAPSKKHEMSSGSDAKALTKGAAAPANDTAGDNAALTAFAVRSAHER